MDYRHKTVLVTGGTGSFGNFVVRRLLNAGVREVRVLSRDEKKQYDMRVFYQGRKDLTFVIGDIRNREVVDQQGIGSRGTYHQGTQNRQEPPCWKAPR